MSIQGCPIIWRESCLMTILQNYPDANSLFAKSNTSHWRQEYSFPLIPRNFRLRKTLCTLRDLIYGYNRKNHDNPHFTLYFEEKNMTLKKHHSTRSQGFSLVELLILLAIIAILAGMSGVALMKWIPQANLKRAARTIVSMCQDARIEAIKRNQLTAVACSQGNNTCSIYLEDGTIFRQFNLGILNSNVRLTGSYSTNFNSRGRATSAGSIPIVNSAANSLTITVRSSGSIITN